MIINHNISAMYANRQLGITGQGMDRNIERLSSGMRINRGGDDASGLAVSEKLRAQIRGLNQAGRNIQGGISFVQTAEGYLDETQSILHRVRELAVQSANGIYTAEDRAQISVEVSQLVDELNRVANHAQFNTLNMFTGRFTNNGGESDGIAIQLGANMDQNIRMYVGAMDAQALGLENAQGAQGRITIESADSANQAIGVIDGALQMVSKQRADLGAYQNRMTMAYNGVSVAAENMQASESVLRDTNMAQEMVDFVKNQILTQANTAMLAQANQRPNAVLALLQ